MTDTGPCRSQALHQWHPTGYIGHVTWADDAIAVATQSQCPGCGGLEIWTPKRSDLRLRGADWTWPTCIGVDAGGKPCGREAICERFIPEPIAAGDWWPVCFRHTGILTVTAWPPTGADPHGEP